MRETLTDMGKAEVEQLLRETGHALTIADLPDILRMDALCEAFTRREDCDQDFIRRPVAVGKTMLHPLTMEAVVWLQDGPLTWWATEPDMMLYAHAYAHGEARTGVLRDPALWDEREARRIVRRWVLRLRVTPWVLVKAIEGFAVREEACSGMTSRTAAQVGSIVAFLISEYGETPEYWTREAPVEQIRALIDFWNGRQRAELEAAAAPGSQPPVPESKLALLVEIRKHRNAMRVKWQTAA